MNNILQELKAAADKAFGKGELQIELAGDPGFSKAWEISNSYFYDRYPAAVAFPKTTEQVAWCIIECNKLDIQFRVRSGGHQHEAMCTANGSLMIRLSKMKLISLNSEVDPTEAWIESGTSLGAVYKKLGYYGKAIAGGGCGGVNVGGLTQGGGWGLYSRMEGLTCDNVLEAEIVLANGQIVKTSSINEPDLFWAIRGGGGGNFGIVTKIRFQLLNLFPGASRYRFFWEQKDMEQVINAWMTLQKKLPHELTSFLRLQVVKERTEKEDPYPIYASGLFQGFEDELRELMAPMIDLVRPAKFSFETIPPTNDVGELWAEWSTYDIFEFDARNSMEENEEDCNVPPPVVTCSAPHPHKVSSAFPVSTDSNEKLANEISTYMAQSQYSPWVRSYMTFHSMGGAIANEPKGGTAFPFRKKPFMLQFQSWWNYPENDAKSCIVDRERQQVYIDWVKNFRECLKPHVEGAFINFVDKELGPDPSTDKGRKALLREYYGRNLKRLMEVKKTYDPGNYFHFEMSIPGE